MQDPQEELLQVAREMEARLRLLQDFGVRWLQRKDLPPSASKITDAAQVEADEQALVAAGDGYKFGEARRAKWEQAARAPTEQEADKETAAPAHRQQATLFGQPAELLSEEPVGWQPNPLSAEEAQAQLTALREDIGDCSRCRLSQGRPQLVFGEGHPVARLVFAGEGPGRDEDLSGRPFVGRAGQLLEKIIAAMGFRREEVYICNVVKCRPPDNRTPQDDEMRTCGQFLTRQLEILRPQFIVALGATAAKYLVGSDQSMGKLRGRFFPHPSGAKIMPTYHPAYLLRSPGAKKMVWEDVQKVMAQMAPKPEEQR